MNIIIGFGFVGQAVYSSLNYPSSAMIIDPTRGTSTKDSNFTTLLNANSGMGGSYDATLIVCVGTPSNDNGSCNINAFVSVWEDIKDYNGLIIIKSTLPKDVIPSNPNVVYNPEFLNANTAIRDFKKQDYIVLGGELDWTLRAERWYKQDTVVVGEYEHCSKQEASDFKYLRNIYNAYKLLFWEYVQDTTGNSRKIAQMMENIPIGENSMVGMDGFRGFGGACLPKDVSAFNSANKHKLTEFLLDYNKDLN